MWVVSRYPILHLYHLNQQYRSKMEPAESLQEFYRRKFNEVPGIFSAETGHFNLFHLEPYREGAPTRIPYRRRDFYKIMLVRGQGEVHFADRMAKVQKQALTFSNPQIPYKWEYLDKIEEGVYCIFNQQLFHQFGQLQQYEVFRPDGHHFFELNDDEANQIAAIFTRMEAEFKSDYKYKYDVIRNLVYELIHFGLKLQPSIQTETRAINASHRISALFLELLERQFPIDDNHRTIHLRTPTDFARQLNIHVNHLNRSVRENLQKTTTQVISERLIQEARILLRHSKWSISEIAYALGFSEATHFNNYFKKHCGVTPTGFRNV